MSVYELNVEKYAAKLIFVREVMTSLVVPEWLPFAEECIDSNNTLQTNNNNYKKHPHRHVLKSKDNTVKHRCKKALKQKLKKYKLRRDGEEDPDVLDVTKAFLTSLRIHSLKEFSSEIQDLDYLRPKNYLFKMVRRKLTTKVTDASLPMVKSSKCEENGLDLPIVVNSQEKKKTNAFQLLMDSRNKSIGGNSPGKDKNDDLSDSEEVTQRKSDKAKRKILLQKMAEAKGALKNREIEDLQDEIIQKKLKKRAENLKQMIMKNSNKAKPINSKKNVKSNDSEHSDEVAEKNIPTMQSKALKIVDIFNILEVPVDQPPKKQVPKEDLEFLQKLSPSLKKKESMLSYFKKVDKDSESSQNQDKADNVIKVKLKRKKKHKKLSLNKDKSEPIDVIDIYDKNSKNHDIITEPTELATVEDTNITETIISDRQKRKRSTKSEVTISEDSTVVHEGRPKRSVKRPVKYNDDGRLSSSDDDLHIFTPKKKKHIDNINMLSNKPEDSKLAKTDDGVSKSNSKSEKKISNKTKYNKIHAKPVKLAPIFASKPDPAALVAKQKFLQSGVPDKLKKINSQQKNIIVDNSFPVVVHVQQGSTSPQFYNLELDQPEVSMCEDIEQLKYENIFQTLLLLNEVKTASNVDFGNKKSSQNMLHHIKQLHPRFPVYRTYSYLRGLEKGELKDSNLNLDNSVEIMYNVDDIMNDYPDRLSWTGKYKPHSSNQIIGNFECIKELRKWLISWTENVMKSKPKSNCDSDSSEYYQSDTDSRDSIKNLGNLIILTGPAGCGKTSSVYAVASELAMKVIEVNASSKRTGKIMLQDLQEATQSHKVNRGPGILDNSQKSQEKTQDSLSTKIKKRGRRPKKGLVKEDVSKAQSKKNIISSSQSCSQESIRTDSSLILVDDADIVFEQDDGFSSAILQLVQSSKRPVILITSSLVCPHLQRFLQSGKILKLHPLVPRLLGTWLDIMCLADAGMCWPGIGAKILNYFKGDIRKTMNYLQFFVSSYVLNCNLGEETASQNIENCNENIDEESSNMAWTDSEETDNKRLGICNNVDDEINPVWVNFISLNCNLLRFRHPIHLFNIWWSVPSLLNIPLLDDDNVNNKQECTSQKQKTVELESIANVLESVSLSDYLLHEPNSEYDIVNHPWYSPETNSVSEQESFQYYNRNNEVTNEICHTMVTCTILTAQSVMGCDRRTEVGFPGMTFQRERDRIVSRHKNLTTYMNASAALDRRGLALDYWPSCRTICRIEKSKNDASSKRNNRFCHYLKSLSVLCKSDTFDNLCDSLCSKDGTNGFSE